MKVRHADTCQFCRKGSDTKRVTISSRTTDQAIARGPMCGSCLATWTAEPLGSIAGFRVTQTAAEVT